MRTAAAIAAAVLAAIAAWIPQAHFGADLTTLFEVIIATVQGFLVPASIRTVHTT